MIKPVYPTAYEKEIVLESRVIYESIRIGYNFYDKKLKYDKNRL